MITLKHNARQVVDGLLTSIAYLNPGTGILNAAIKTEGYNLLLPLIKTRVHVNGIATDGSPIGSILVRTGQLRDSLVTLPEGIGFADDAMISRAQQLETKYGKPIWDATLAEEQQVIQLAQNIVNNAFSGK